MAKVGVRGHLHQDLLSSIRACYVIPLFYSYRTIPEVSVVEVTDTAIWRQFSSRACLAFGGRYSGTVGALASSTRCLSAATRALSKLAPAAALLRFPRHNKSIQTVLSSTNITFIYQHFLLFFLFFNFLACRLSVSRLSLPLLIYVPIMSRVTPPVTKLTHAVRRISSSAQASHSSILLDSNSNYLPRSIKDLKAECSKRQLKTGGSKSEVNHYQTTYMVNG